ncbi:MAG TPA: fumarylacetoacetate hydrolase family protein [Pseudonocardia sp.]|nr:fumarylacetoacetate hydrolase family protein [Pseudonocardia sp.]
MAPLPFGLGRFETATGTRFDGVVVGERTVAPLATFDPARTRIGDLFADWAGAVDRIGRLLDTAEAPYRLDELRPLPPVHPAQILQAGANYRTHVIDLHVADAPEGTSQEQLDALRAEVGERLDRRASTGTPYLFAGLPSALCGAEDDVLLPVHGDRPDWELEVAVVLARPAYRIAPEEVDRVIAGYVMVNDLTLRDRVFPADLGRIGADWVGSKNAPTFLPTGPWLRPAAFVDDPARLRIRLALNGATMQDASTADMIFDVRRVVSYASQLVRLGPGDLVLTGSPAGNGAHHGRFLREGDVLDAEITGLGRQRNRCVRAPEPDRAGPPTSAAGSVGSAGLAVTR